MEAGLLLLGTKITIPLIPTKSIRRPRLTDWIKRGVRGPLTLLLTPAGFGKTNLPAEWAAESPHLVAWLTPSGDDSDPVRFFRRLTGALQKVDPPESWKERERAHHERDTLPRNETPHIR